MSKTPEVGTERGTERIEAFSDGVFAIAITLLILEIKIPHPSAQPGPFQLVVALLELWPSYFAYVLSFVMVGIYWANHHYIFKLFDKTDHGLNLLNLLFLMFIAFLPLPTEALGTYMLDEANRTTAVTFYALGLLAPAAGWLLMWVYARRGFRLVNRDLDDRFLRRLTLQYALSVAVYTGAVVVSLISYWWGLAICTGLMLLYLLPPRRPVYRSGGRSAA
jgi:uncharacterized membrane protein